MIRALDGHDSTEEEQRCERPDCAEFATFIREATTTEEGEYLCETHALEAISALVQDLIRLSKPVIGCEEAWQATVDRLLR